MTAPGNRGVFLEDLTWEEAAARFKDNAVVIVPIGASAKEHGPHLPLKTDYLYARELARRVAAELPVVVAPVIGFGYYPAFANYPGSQHLRAETFVALVADLLNGFIDHGATRIAIINTGVSTEAPLQLAVRDIWAKRRIKVAVADVRTLGRGTDKLLEQKMGGHADERETSILLRIEPAAVRMERARPDYGHCLDMPATVFRLPATLSADPASGADYSATGAIGDPTLATVEKGEAILAEMTRELVAGLRINFPDAFGD